MDTEDSSSQAVALRDPDLVPTMVTNVRETKARLDELQAFVKDVMVPGEDYGVIPGTKKPVLLKPGAEKLCEVYGYAQQVEVVTRVEDWEKPFFHYEVRCELLSKRTGRVIGAGVGSCNSLEARYRWRDAQRLCPQCGAPAIIKGKDEYGGGFLCYAKKGGCGVKFADDDTSITEQTLGKVENDDVYTLVNTILKMAKKRAVVDATLSVTRSSALFTQDEEAIEASHGASSAPRGTSARNAAPPAPGTISEAQQKRLWARARAAGHPDDDVRAYLETRWGVTSTAAVRRPDYDAIITRLDHAAALGSLAADEVGEREPGEDRESA